MVSGAVGCRAQAQMQPQTRAPQAQTEWPKSVITANGTVISLYEPQVFSYSRI